MKNPGQSRRNFLKTSALGAAGIMATGGAMRKVNAAWTDRIAINPNIDNLRVVCCHDPSMIKTDPLSLSFANQNAAVDKDRIAANMDAMAMTLASKPTAAEAWATIFRKPATKTWNQVRVAIKVNTISTDIMPRAAVVGKFCTVLHALGVPYGNIVLYDWNDKHWNAINTVLYNAYLGKEIPAGVLVNNDNNAPAQQGSAVDYLHGHVEVPMEGYAAPIRCVGDIATGAIDILINLAVNKYHGLPEGETSLTMKNHYGTFFPWDHGEVKSFSGAITAITKSDALIGGSPARQQLCFIDSLWAATSGGVDCTPAKLIMGTFSPVVDWLTLKRLRMAEMGCNPSNAESATSGRSVMWWATNFGYAYSEYQALNFIAPGGAVGSSHPHQAQAGELKFVLSSNVFRSAQVSIPIQLTGNSWDISIMDMQGRMIREMKSRGNLKSDMIVLWDGTTQSAMTVPPGTYVVRISLGRINKSASLTCVKR